MITTLQGTSRLLTLLVFALAGGVSAFSQPSQPELRVKHIVGLEYPWFARFGVIQGDVELAATVSRDGSVTEVRILSGVLPLAMTAKEALAKWSFGGCASPSGCEIRITFSFALSGFCEASSHCPSTFEADLPDRVRVSAKSFKAIAN